jgi:hypothetical protein
MIAWRHAHRVGECVDGEIGAQSRAGALARGSRSHPHEIRVLSRVTTSSRRPRRVVRARGHVVVGVTRGHLHGCLEASGHLQPAAWSSWPLRRSPAPRRGVGPGQPRGERSRARVPRRGAQQLIIQFLAHGVNPDLVGSRVTRRSAALPRTRRAVAGDQ